MEKNCYNLLVNFLVDNVKANNHFFIFKNVFFNVFPKNCLMATLSKFNIIPIFKNKKHFRTKYFFQDVLKVEYKFNGVSVAVKQS